VETAPGQGYPRQWADQVRWKGGWELDRKGRLRLKAGGPVKKLLTIFSNPDLPAIDDYYEPFTYDYETLVEAPLGDLDPVARPHSQLTGQPMDVTWGPTGTRRLRVDRSPRPWIRTWMASKSRFA
jgi:nitrate reductase beta subunit